MPFRDRTITTGNVSAVRRLATSEEETAGPKLPCARAIVTDEEDRKVRELIASRDGLWNGAIAAELDCYPQAVRERTGVVQRRETRRAW